MQVNRINFIRMVMILFVLFILLLMEDKYFLFIFYLYLYLSINNLPASQYRDFIIMLKQLNQFYHSLFVCLSLIQDY